MSPFSRKELGIHSTPGRSTRSRRSSSPIGGSLGLEIKLREGLSPRVWGERVRAWGRESWREREWYGLVSERERFKTLVGPRWQKSRPEYPETNPEYPDSQPEIPGSQWFPEINYDWVDLICFENLFKHQNWVIWHPQLYFQLNILLSLFLPFNIIWFQKWREPLFRIISKEIFSFHMLNC